METDPLKIATEFNSFFTRVGKQISNSIPEVAKAPEDYVNYNRRIVGGRNIRHFNNARPFWNKWFILSMEHSTCITCKDDI